MKMILTSPGKEKSMKQLKRFVCATLALAIVFSYQFVYAVSVNDSLGTSYAQSKLASSTLEEADFTVGVGEIYNIDGRPVGAVLDEWSIEDTSIAQITAGKNTLFPTIKGNKAGTTKITHKYKYFGTEKTDTYIIRVVAVEKYNFRYSSLSSNAQLYYSVYNDGAFSELQKLTPGEEVVIEKTLADEDPAIVFYVRPTAGYISDSQFEMSEGRNGYSNNFASGTYSYVDSWSNVMRGDIDLTSINNKAKELECTRQFFHSYMNKNYRYREFKINATPIEVLVEFYDKDGRHIATGDQNGIYHENVVEFTNHSFKTTGAASKEGYDFVGWQIEGHDDIYAKNTSVTINDDIWDYVDVDRSEGGNKKGLLKLYAKYEPKSIYSYKVNHIYEDGNTVTETIENATFGNEMTYTQDVKTGYLFDKAEYPNGNKVTANNDGNIVNVYYAKQKFDVVFNYIDEDSNESISDTRTVSDIKYGTNVDGQSYKKDIDNYVFTAAEQAEITQDGQIINVYYSKDENNDGKPDKCQIEVTFNVVNGTWEDGTNTAFTRLVTLTDSDNKPAENGTYDLSNDLPNSSADNGYEKGKWNTEDFQVSRTNKEFTISYTAQPRTITVNYVNSDNEGIHDSYTADTFYGEEYNLAEQIMNVIDTVNDHYILINENIVVEGKIDEDLVMNLVYGLDNVGPNGTSDGILDIYQVRVDFAAVNGIVDGNPYTYVTLLDEDGNPSIGGTGHLSANQIPAFAAEEGYENGVWDVEPTTELDINETTTFTITYSAIQEEEDPVVPVQPENPTNPTNPTEPNEPDVPATPVTPTAPAAPAAPVNPAPAVQGAVTTAPGTQVIPDADTPLAGGDTQPVQIDDTEVPLANADSGNWALINLILSAVTILLGIVVMFAKTRSKSFIKALGAIVAVASAAVFFITEDISSTMVMTDKWTLLMASMAVVNAVVLAVGYKYKNNKDGEDFKQA